jgi:hypothetical protein
MAPDMSNKKNCPLCSRMIDADATSCHGCGYEFKKKAVKKEDDQKYSSSDMSKKKNCPICSRMVDFDSDTCRGCGYTFKKKEKKPSSDEKTADGKEEKKADAKPEISKDPSKRKSCPICSRALNIDAESCYSCGFKFKKKPDGKKPGAAQPSAIREVKKPEPKVEEKKPEPVVEAPKPEVKEPEPVKIPEITAAPAPKYEVQAEPGKKISCPVCSKQNTANVSICGGCGYVFSKKPEPEVKPDEKKVPAGGPIPPRLMRAKVMATSEVEKGLFKLMDERKERLKSLREQISSDESRLRVMKIKMDATVKIFEEQRKRHLQKIDSFEKEIENKKAAMREEEKKVWKD